MCKHNRSKTPEYKCWLQIKSRCLNSNHRMYPHYGGRGITIAPEWAKDFPAFLEHVGERPSSNHSLDRIDNEAGYVPGNLKWATWEEQANNRRPTSGVKLRETDSSRTTNYKHGGVGTSEYSTWASMKDRCLNPKSVNYPNWGGRGITIHPPWIDDFQAFYDYVGKRPSREYSLDRIDNDGNYEPGNVRWATKKQQRANQRDLTVTGPEHPNYKHGATGEGSKKKRKPAPEYKTWGAIKNRCFNEKGQKYQQYGAKGITMCSRWKDDFASFLEDVGQKPSPGYTILRINLEGSYTCGKCPECLSRGWEFNCRWATRTEINRSRRASSRAGKLNPEKAAEIRRLYDLKGSQKVPRKQIAEQFGIGVSLVGKIGRREVWI